MPCSPRTGHSTFDCFKCLGTQLVSLLVSIKNVQKNKRIDFALNNSPLR